MEPRKKGDGFRLSNGVEIYAHGGVLGIDPNLGVSEGWDGGLEGYPYFTPEERREIAAYMVDLWTRWGAGEGEPR